MLYCRGNGCLTLSHPKPSGSYYDYYAELHVLELEWLGFPLRWGVDMES
jgi:hypothetical protein